MLFVSSRSGRRQAPMFLFATILLVGDSHTYLSFGRKLDSLLRTLPQSQVATYASCGSSPYNWFTGLPTRCGYLERDPDGRSVDLLQAPTPLFADLLARYKPDLTVIALGHNLYSAPFEHSATTVHQMAEMTSLAHSRCVWIAPPDSRIRTGAVMTELYGILRGASAPYCQFVDSRALTHYPAAGGDGLHYDSLGTEGVKQAETWAVKIFEKITQPGLAGSVK